jgi:hypothetical protein
MYIHGHQIIWIPSNARRRWMEVMRDPVITADGQTYEQAEIEESWFALGKRTSPLTGAELPSTHVTPNIALRSWAGSVSAFQQRVGVSAFQQGVVYNIGRHLLITGNYHFSCFRLTAVK